MADLWQVTLVSPPYQAWTYERPSYLFDILEGQKAGVGGEIQLTDALQGLADQDKLIAVKLGGQRFDAGDWVEYLTANIYFALQDEELRDELVKRLRELLSCSS